MEFCVIYLVVSKLMLEMIDCDVMCARAIIPSNEPPQALAPSCPGRCHHKNHPSRKIFCEGCLAFKCIGLWFSGDLSNIHLFRLPDPVRQPYSY